ncbi:hypothetical protein PMAYCL1PPCAC_06085 [Pristionchus mayeri]|uniref:Uncharacterized protein n=1 Tax=Pristionchus mayeri TaxID=1317129 RepID=A0AAN4ZDV5_9BILA|nr:hypothetical protein PMAYCL1PPCAC_06085 [Pristionchus mayeri]
MTKGEWRSMHQYSKEVAPPSEEEMIIIKREFGHLISTNPDIQDEVYAGIPNKFTSMFPTISMKIAQLKAVASRKFESYNDEMKETIKDVDSLLNFHLQWPISLLLEKKMTSYEERELNDRQIEMEIKKKQDELTDLWSADDPYAYLYLTDHKIADVNKERREDKIGKERRRMRNEEFYQAKKKLKNEL